MSLGSYQTNWPSIYPGFVGWLDAADTSTITSSGGLVSSIRNKANAAIPFIQGTGAAQPTTGTRTIGPWNVLDFDGSSDFLSANALAAYFTGADKPMTVFAVCQSDNTAPATQQSQWSLGYSVTTNPIFYSYYRNSDNEITRRDDPGTIITNGLGLIAGVNINCTVFTGTAYSSYTNATTNASSVAMDVGNLTLDTFSIGALSRTTNSQFFDGVIGEVIIYNRALTDPERISVQNYLGQKWGQITT